MTTAMRFSLQPSEKEGFWIARDNEAGITIEFRENNYNEEQNVTLDNQNVTEEDAQRMATALRELGEWLNVEHPYLIFNAEETAQFLTSILRSVVQRLVALQDGEPIQVEGGNYVEQLLYKCDEGVRLLFYKMEQLLSPNEATRLCERINFECDVVNRGHRAAVGARIRTLRQDAGLTQHQLAERAGITRANLANIEMGKYSAGLDILWKIAATLGKKIYID